MTDVETGQDSISNASQSAETRSRTGRVNPIGIIALGMLGVVTLGLTVALAVPPEAAPEPMPGTPSPVASPYFAPFNPRAIIQGGHRLEREPVAQTTLVPTLTPYLTPTVVPVTPIPWTGEDYNALTWLCYEEVRGMKEARYDACLSVISTVRRRYAYEDDPYGEDTIEQTLLRTNQFPISFDLDRPAPDDFLAQAVDEYQWGARGSCTGFLYYDSVPGGPSLCVIEAANGQFVEFHNGWR